MKKKLVALVVSFSVLSICAAATGVSLVKKADSVKGTLPLQSMTLDSASDVYEIDSGVAHQVDIKNNKFDIVGYQAVASKFGSIKKATYGSYDYNGMIYNRSVINGFEYLTVNFTGGNLYYTFTDFLMEDMSFDQSNQLTSGTSVAAGGKAYFVVYNPSITPVEIESLTVEYTCDGSIDDEMIYDKSTTLGYARSGSKTTVKEDSFVTLENNPRKDNNNYSVGKTGDHKNDDTWYRWNGRYFTDSEKLGTEFSFGMTIVGDYSRMIDPSKYFHYGVWPQFGYYDKDGVLQTSSWDYAMVYIGNDNYEPLGKEHALHPGDKYVNYSYEGRFFTDYRLNSTETDYIFADPDNDYLLDGVTTFREAYEAYNLPFWFVRFDVYLDEDSIPAIDASVNGFKLFTSTVLVDYDTVNKPDLFIHTLPMHVVNYGVDAEGNPGESYKGAFTYPRVIS